MAEGDREEFRLQPLMKHVVGAAVWLWVVILGALVWHGGFPGRTWLSALFFIALFSAVLIFYGGLTISADRYGVTYRGLASFRNYPYESILKVDVRPGLAGWIVYDVFTKRGMLQFSSFIKGHRRLVELIVDRADLARRGRVTGL